MGYAERIAAAQRQAAAEAAAALAVRLHGFRVVLDVQHLFRLGPLAADRGTVYTLPNGTTITEGAAACAYAAAAAAWLRAHGATVFTNDVAKGTLVGPYSRRNATANALRVHAYVACHVNAGMGSYAAAEYMAGSAGGALGSEVGAVLTKTFRAIQSSRCVPLAAKMRGAVCVAGVDRRIPAIVFEPFFGDNPHMQAIFEPAYLTALGFALGTGLMAWWDKASASASGAAVSNG